MARLYLASPDPSQWRYTGMMGAFVILLDRQRGNDIFYLRMIDLAVSSITQKLKRKRIDLKSLVLFSNFVFTKQRRAPVWEQEIYRNFHYSAERTFFHTFATDVS